MNDALEIVLEWELSLLQCLCLVILLYKPLRYYQSLNGSSYPINVYAELHDHNSHRATSSTITVSQRQALPGSYWQCMVLTHKLLRCTFSIDAISMGKHGRYNTWA